MFVSLHFEHVTFLWNKIEDNFICEWVLWHSLMWRYRCYVTVTFHRVCVCVCVCVQVHTWALSFYRGFLGFNSDHQACAASAFTCWAISTGCYIFFFLFYGYGCFVCMCVCVPHVCGPCWGQKRVLGPLELKLQCVCCCVGCGTWPWVLWKTLSSLQCWAMSSAPQLTLYKKKSSIICVCDVWSCTCSFRYLCMCIWVHMEANVLWFWSSLIPQGAS
jgi:hypothetical protein